LEFKKEEIETPGNISGYIFYTLPKSSSVKQSYVKIRID